MGVSKVERLFITMLGTVFGIMLMAALGAGYLKWAPNS